MTQPTEPDYEDAAVADKWCEEMRQEVAAYLEEEDYAHGGLEQWPTWHVAPYVSLWQVESAATPGVTAAWVICGDLPTDLIADTGVAVEHPRVVLAALATRWMAYAANLRDGESNDGIDFEGIEDPDEIRAVLQVRAEILEEWAKDDELWEEDESR